MLRKRENKTISRNRAITSVLLIALASTILLPSTGIAQDDAAASGKCEVAIQGLRKILNKLEQEITHLQNADFPALEEHLEGIGLLLENLIADLETPPAADQEGPTRKEQIIKLDLTLHRLVALLERIAAANEPTPSPKARETIAELRIWIDGYIAGQAQPNTPEKDRLVIERIGVLLVQLDQYIIRTFGRPAVVRPPHQP